MTLENIENIIDDILIELVDNGFTVKNLTTSKETTTWINFGKKDFKLNNIKNYILTLEDYLYNNGYRIKYITLDKASIKDTYTKFPIFAFNEIRKFKMLIKKSTN